MENLISFYNTLFGIEVTVFGIIFATIFVFVQLVFSKFSHRQLTYIFLDKFLILYLVISLLNIALTVGGSYFLSLPAHNFLPWFDLNTNVIVSSPIYVLICVILFFISIGIFGFIVANNLPYLSPKTILILYSKKIQYKQIRDFLLNKYGVSIPYKYEVFRYSKYTSMLSEIEATDEKEIEKIRKETDKKAKKDKKIYDDIVSKSKETEIEVSNAEDPLLPLSELTSSLIVNLDSHSLQEAVKCVEDIIDDFFTSAPKLNKKWIPEEEIATKFTNYIIEFIDEQFEIAAIQDVTSLQKKLISLTKTLAFELYRRGDLNEVKIVQEYWKRLANESINKNPFVFKEIVSYYKSLNEKVFEDIKGKKPNKPNSRLGIVGDEVIELTFKNVGWLAERLLTKKELEVKPLMQDYDYRTELDDVIDLLIFFEDDYVKDHPDLYPLIYFDALEVVYMKLVEIYAGDRDNHELENSIYSLLGVYSYFAESAITVKNIEGASLAATRLSRTFRHAEQNKADKFTKYITEQILRLGAEASKAKKKSGFLGNLDDWAIEELKKGKDIKVISGEVMEIFIKTMGKDSEKVWKYITKLGLALGSNFGLMFDWMTGETYAKDDPRRR